PRPPLLPYTPLFRSLQSTIATDTTLLQTVIGSSVSLALRNTLILIGGIVAMVITNAKLTLMVVICVPLVVFPILIFGRRVRALSRVSQDRSEEHTSELQSRENLVCRLL